MSGDGKSKFPLKLFPSYSFEFNNIFFKKKKNYNHKKLLFHSYLFFVCEIMSSRYYNKKMIVIQNFFWKIHTQIYTFLFNDLESIFLMILYFFNFWKYLKCFKKYFRKLFNRHPTGQKVQKVSSLTQPNKPSIMLLGHSTNLFFFQVLTILSTKNGCHGPAYVSDTSFLTDESNSHQCHPVITGANGILGIKFAWSGFSFHVHEIHLGTLRVWSIARKKV